MHIYDYIIIGGGITGLNIAAKISQETQNVLLIESETQVQGANKAVPFANTSIENGLRFFPANSLGQKAISSLEDLMGMKLKSNIQDNHVETYEANGFKPFAGFGAHAPLFYNQVAYFLNNRELKTTIPWFKITEILKEKFLGKILTQSFVTGMNTTDGKLTHVTVNGSKTFYANNFIFAGTTRDLIHLLPDEILSARAKAKLKKDTTWVGLCLDLCHENLTTDKTNMFLLEGTTNDSIGPCIGRFHTPQINEVSPEKSTQISQWISFIDLETSEETENIAELLKKVKRQIKRAFPEMYEAVKSERLYITSPLSAGELKLNANGTMPKAENLWIASSQANIEPNLLGSLLQAQFILSSLGFGSVDSNLENELHTEI